MGALALLKLQPSKHSVSAHIHEGGRRRATTKNKEKLDQQYMCVYVSGLEKRDHFVLIVDLELVVLCKSTTDGLSVALCCTSVAAPVPRICSLKVRKYARCVFVYAHFRQ